MSALGDFIRLEYEPSALGLTLCGVGLMRQASDRLTPHASPLFALLHVMSGSGRLLKNGKLYRVGESSGFLLMPNEIASYAPDPGGQWSYCLVTFTGQNAQRFCEGHGLFQSVPVYTAPDGERAQKAASALCRAAEIGASGDELVGRLLLFFGAALPKAAGAPSVSTTYADRAGDYIAANYAYALTVEGIAGYLNIDRSHLYRLFKQRFGVSVQEYLLAFRLRAAAMQLKTTSNSLSEICFACGFNDYSHFSKIFSKHYGLSPRAYRDSKD